jgi:hypothetical protein
VTVRSRSALGVKQAVRDALLAAAEAIGQDGAGMDGLKGYFVRLEKLEPVAFATLFGKAYVPQASAQPAASAHPYEDFSNDAIAELRRRIIGVAARLAPPPAVTVEPEPDAAESVSVVIDHATAEPTAIHGDPTRAKPVNESLIALHVPGPAEAIVIGPATNRTYPVEGAQWDRLVRVVESDARALLRRTDWSCLNHGLAVCFTPPSGGIVSGELTISAEAERALAARASSGTDISRKEHFWGY